MCVVSRGARYSLAEMMKLEGILDESWPYIGRICQCSTRAANALLLEIFLFWFTDVCEIRLYSELYGPEHSLLSLSDTPFCAYFKYNSKNTRCLQVYYTPNDCSTLFYVKIGKAVATYKLRPIRTSLYCYLVCTCVSTNDNKTQGAYD